MAVYRVMSTSTKKQSEPEAKRYEPCLIPTGKQYGNSVLLRVTSPRCLLGVLSFVTMRNALENTRFVATGS